MIGPVRKTSSSAEDDSKVFLMLGRVLHTHLLFSAARSESAGPLSRDELTDMMSHILKGQGGDLLPVLQGVCGQVTKLRLDDAAEEKMRNGSWWVFLLRSSHCNVQLQFILSFFVIILLFR